jgi:hypothetical protein
MQKCKQCGALFKPARLKQRFCGAACRILHQSLNPDGMPIEDSEIYGKDLT